MYKSIRPGKALYDTCGKKVHAHGGSILRYADKFYFYGENKEGVTGTATGTPCKIWQNGMRMYSSADLMNWTDEGVIAIDNENADSPFHPSALTDRPHILYNEARNEFVMWVKCGGSLLGVADFSSSYFAVAISDKITGPYKFVKKVVTDFPAGDFDFAKDDGKTYVIHERPHDALVCRRLTDDLTDLTDEYSLNAVKKAPPYTREAPAFFKRNGRKFLLTSGTTGYYPNETLLYEITDIHGEWKELGTPCVGDINKNSFHAQFSSVFEYKGNYFALGDRWLTDLPPVMPDINEIFRILCSPDENDKSACKILSELSDENTSEACYIWLPIKFDGSGTPYIEWVNEWKPEI